jgi:exodeoxyribonuclease V alpha subunit
MRQDDDSSIIELCQGVSKSFVPYNLFNKKSDLYFYPADSTATLEKILIFVQAFLNKGGSILNDLQILAPMYAGPCGINAINKAIQDKFNDETISITRGSRTFKRLDKVLQLKNDPEKGIMNGDIGYIDSISHTDEMDYLMIRFDNILVKYPAKDLDDLTLAYAISIHKSQGSEFDNVIVPIFKSYNIMLTKNLIYTAITRAKKKLIIIGDPKTLSYAITILSNERQTSLLEFLKDNKNDNRIRINDPEIPFEFDGEYDMEGITPYTFMDY